MPGLPYRVQPTAHSVRVWRKMIAGGAANKKNLLCFTVIAVFVIFLIVNRYETAWEGSATPAAPLYKKIESPSADWVVEIDDLNDPKLMNTLKINDIAEALNPKEDVDAFEKRQKTSLLESKAKVVKPKLNRILRTKNYTKDEVKNSTVAVYPKRENMGECKPLYGKVVIFVAYMKSSYETHYKVAQDSLKCYLAGTNYTTLFVDLYNDSRIAANCPHDQLFFRKHCAASVYLNEADWMLVLDADAGVVNPNHCIEEYIDERVDFVFYERFFNWEIASGNYLVRNTPFARNFLRKWADWQYTQPKNWNGADNGVLQIHILQTVFPHAKAEVKACERIWLRGTGYDTYMAYVTCVKVMLGAQRIFPGKLKIARRAHSFIRDGYLTADNWSEFDFMLHGWKAQVIGQTGWESPFSQMFNVSECGNGYDGWNFRPQKRVPFEKIKKSLAYFEKESGKTFPKQARVHPYLTEPDIGECYPHCDDEV